MVVLGFVNHMKYRFHLYIENVDVNSMVEFLAFAKDELEASGLEEYI